MKRVPIAVASSLLLWLGLGLTPVGCSSEEPSPTSGSGGLAGSPGGSGGPNGRALGRRSRPERRRQCELGRCRQRLGRRGWPRERRCGGQPRGWRGGSARGWLGGSAAGGATGSGGAAVAGGGSSGSVGEEAYPAPTAALPDETGANLWLRYPEVNLPSRLAEYRAGITGIVKAGSSATLQAAQAELVKGLGGLLGSGRARRGRPCGRGAVVLGTPASSTIVSALPLVSRLPAVGAEGYLVEAAEVGGNGALVVAGNSDVGVLRGTFALLRHLQRHRTLQGLALTGAPKIKRRLLNHWDNLDGSVERGYAGRSLWNWGSLPATISQRYTDYARANASLGINGTVLNNVNSNAQILNAQNLDKVAALAAAFRPYGISVYLSARFSAPIELGGSDHRGPARQRGGSSGGRARSTRFTRRSRTSAASW